MSLGEKIKRLRMEQSMTQEQLAEALDVTRQSVSKWETGKGNPDTDKLVAIGQLFGVSMDELIGNQVIQKGKSRKHIRKIIGIILGLFISLILLCVAGVLVIQNRYPQVWQRIEQYFNTDKITIVYEHDNIYTDGIDGLLADLSEKIDFPEYLMLKTSFNLHFAQDGTVDTIDTMWYGYDERYTYVDSYLITFDRSKSDKITVYFNGGTGGVYDAEKDMTVLFDALRVIPLEQSVQNWNQPVYGILYYGVREWGYDTTGIRYIDKDGTVDIPNSYSYTQIQGPTVSVFCPDDESITPMRYIYMKDTSNIK